MDLDELAYTIDGLNWRNVTVFARKFAMMLRAETNFDISEESVAKAIVGWAEDHMQNNEGGA